MDVSALVVATKTFDNARPLDVPMMLVLAFDGASTMLDSGPLLAYMVLEGAAGESSSVLAISALVFVIVTMLSEVLDSSTLLDASADNNCVDELPMVLLVNVEKLFVPLVLSAVESSVLNCDGSLSVAGKTSVVLGVSVVLLASSVDKVSRPLDGSRLTGTLVKKAWVDKFSVLPATSPDEICVLLKDFVACGVESSEVSARGGSSVEELYVEGTTDSSEENELVFSAENCVDTGFNGSTSDVAIGLSSVIVDISDEASGSNVSMIDGITFEDPLAETSKEELNATVNEDRTVEIKVGIVIDVS